MDRVTPVIVTAPSRTHNYVQYNIFKMISCEVFVLSNTLSMIHVSTKNLAKLNSIGGLLYLICQETCFMLKI